MRKYIYCITFSMGALTIYIQREIDTYIDAKFQTTRPSGLILAGIVGSGKTTAVEAALTRLSERFSIHSFTGDDVIFRNAVASNSRYILETVRFTTQGPALVFVDEVQKSEAIFDALKICFDQGMSFIVSGSNPQYLSSIGRKRLQRRADFICLTPLSLAEILAHHGHVPAATTNSPFAELLKHEQECRVPNLGISLNESIKGICQTYFVRGGLPLAYLSATQDATLSQVQLVTERGFDVMSHDSSNVSDLVRSYLARSHSREFAYQGVFQRTGIRSRSVVNSIIEELTGHGYLIEKRPIFPGLDRRSYLVSYSYVDPGILSYLTGDVTPTLEQIGSRLEGTMHVRLQNLLQYIPLKSMLSYFKPFTVDQNDKTKFLPGEIDFVFSCGKRLIPIEVKLTSDVSAIETRILESFIKEYKTPFGIVLYGGVPQARPERKLIYWPYWFV